MFCTILKLSLLFVLTGCYPCHGFLYTTCMYTDIIFEYNIFTARGSDGSIVFGIVAKFFFSVSLLTR